MVSESSGHLTPQLNFPLKFAFLRPTSGSEENNYGLFLSNTCNTAGMYFLCLYKAKFCFPVASTLLAAATSGGAQTPAATSQSCKNNVSTPQTHPHWRQSHVTARTNPSALSWERKPEAHVQFAHDCIIFPSNGHHM